MARHQAELIQVKPRRQKILHRPWGNVATCSIVSHMEQRLKISAWKHNSFLSLGSPEMDYQSLGNIFKGLAASGSWGCFDEFNRLIPEVLSVCTVQFKAVCDGTARYDNDQLTTHHVIIEGDQVNLDPTCGAFITMNPVRSWFLHYICTCLLCRVTWVGRSCPKA